MSQLTGGELVVRQLKKEGIDVLFGLVGGHLSPIFEACDRLKMKVLDVRHEAAAAHMAEAFGRLTRKPGICLVTAGPGFTNCLTGVQNAFMSCSPMLVISGRAGITQEHKLALQDMNQIDIIRPMTKWAATVHQTERIPELVSMACRHATQGRPGPTYLEIPFELVFDKLSSKQVTFPDNNRRLRPLACEHKAVEEALDLLSGARKPVLVAGSGAFYGNAASQLQSLIERTHIPLFTLNGARGLVPDSHPDCYGHALPFTIGPAAIGLPEADVMVLLGTRVSMYLTFGQPPVVNTECKLIQVDIDPTEIGRNRDVTLGIPGDVNSFLEHANQILDQKSLHFDTKKWITSLKKGIPRIQKNYEPFLTKAEIPIHPLRLCAEIDRFLGNTGLVVSDGGDTQTWMPMVRKVEQPGSYLDSGLFGCLGVGFPFALTAKYLHPEQTVVLFNGDGSMGFNMMEFDTAMRHKLPIIVVVNNDMAWGMIKHMNELALGKDTEQGSELGLVRYDRIAESLGGYGELIRYPDEIEGALRRAQAQKMPACLNVVTDTTAISPGTTSLNMLFAGSLIEFNKK
ncbi:thiamine pyrophosphate-binding protein [candidate division CSSED10-310 bacterium]|uniref:Thiamine pyrophosphate-binding protein n=1 Tax=candidate division CSSED10-310 bacterium TaxID=2855610 RepID=A0ABV6Z702_UNCC1